MPLAFRYQKKVSNIIDDVLEWSPKLALSGMMEKHAVINTTESSDSASKNSSAFSSAEETTADVEVETSTDEVGEGNREGDTVDDEAVE